MKAIENNSIEMYHTVKHRQGYLYTRMNALMSKELHAHQIQMNARKTCAMLRRINYSNNNHNILPSNTSKGHWPESLVKTCNLEWKGKTQLNSKMLSAKFPNTGITNIQAGQWMWQSGSYRKKGEKRMHIL
jgi:hypothetical protein